MITSHSVTSIEFARGALNSYYPDIFILSFWVGICFHCKWMLLMFHVDEYNHWCFAYNGVCTLELESGEGDWLFHLRVLNFLDHPNNNFYFRPFIRHLIYTCNYNLKHLHPPFLSKKRPCRLWRIINHIIDFVARKHFEKKPTEAINIRALGRALHVISNF